MRSTCRLEILAILLLLLVGLSAGPGAGEEAPAYPESRVRPLGAAARGLAKDGQVDAASELIDRMVDLGYAADKADRLRKDVERAARRAGDRGDPRARQRAARAIRSEVKRLAARLPDVPEAARKRAAGILIGLDGSCADAHRLLGHVQVDGRWRTPEDARLLARRTAFQEALRKARRLPVDVKIVDGPASVLEAATGRKGSRVVCGKVEVHGLWPAPRLARVLRESVRAAAVARFLIDGRCEPPPLGPRRFVLVRSIPEYMACLKEYRRLGEIDAAEHAFMEKLGSTYLGRQKPKLVLAACRTEALAEADVTYTLLYSTLFKPALAGCLGDAQDCLWGGLSNLVCLAHLGQNIRARAWFQSGPGARSTARTEEERLQLILPRAGLMGHRRRLEYLVREKRDPPWARTMVDDLGKLLTDELIKATSVVEYLAERGDLARLLGATYPKAGDERARTAVFQEALGEPLSTFEERWRRWLLREGAADLLSRIEGSAAVAELTAEQEEGLEYLNVLRGGAKLSEVGFDHALAADTAKHARYLVANPDQARRWPDAHEEWPDRKGYSPEGQWAGSHSVIAFDGTVQRSIDAWMATFYHRLPLLHPGLLRVGWGTAKDVVVLDAASLAVSPWEPWAVAWPPSGMKGVPTRFRPEMPNPVPGADQARLGYPITLQVWRDEGNAPEGVTMALHEDREGGPAVACHFSTPDVPTNPDLAPPHAYCLIPKQRLKPSCRYVVVATLTKPTERLVWTFLTGADR